MALAVDDLDDVGAMADLRFLADENSGAIDQAIRLCLAEPATLAIRHRAIELLARVRYESAMPPA